jgi:hypothetical protein
LPYLVTGELRGTQTRARRGPVRTDVGHGCECDVEVQLIGECGLFNERGKGLNGALGVANVAQLALIGRSQHVTHLRGQVVARHVTPRKVPELRIIGRVLYVSHADAIASVVAQPHFVAVICEDVGQRLCGTVQTRPDAVESG